MNDLFIVGLTGSTGAGKSEVARVLAECGCYCIDADALSRQAVLPGSRCLNELVQQFSPAILSEDGSLNRKALAAAAFSSPEQTKQLNAIVHPVVLEMIDDELKQAAQQGYAFAVIDAPLLFQTGLQRLCHRTVAVLTPADVRLQRICFRDGLTKEQAVSRMKAQPEDAFYTERASVIIHNNESVEELADKAKNLFTQMEEWRCEE